jgi:hypothetical protein
VGRIPIQVGGETFATKAAMERRCREIVSGYEDGQMASKEHAMFLLDLIMRRHERPEEKILPGLEDELTGIRVRHRSGHSVYGESATNVNHTFVCYANGREIDFSWKKCCGGFSQKALATQAMRRAIADQVAQYKRWRYAAGSGSVTCDATGAPLPWGDARVDHWPVTFAFLRDSFLSREGVLLESIKTASDPVCGVAMADHELRARWQTYHDTQKTLRLVVVRENELSWRKEGAIR